MKRSLKPELMDNPSLDWNQHREALKGLERINSFSLASEPIWQAMMEIANRKKKLKILDLATGAGDLPLTLAGEAEQLGYDFEIHAVDKNPQAVRYAQEKAKTKGLSVHFFTFDIEKEKIPAGYDVLINSLFLHHLTEDETIAFLRHLKNTNPRMIVINDLIRSQSGLMLAYVGTRLLSRSSVIHYDGPQSVRAAYTVSEMEEIAKKSGLNPVSIKELWPARFLLTWKN